MQIQDSDNDSLVGESSHGTCSREHSGLSIVLESVKSDE
jgi:hypothetical protein